MEKNELLDALRGQLCFFEGGGYGHSNETSLPGSLLFRDSPTCPNAGSVTIRPCRECVLCPLIPPEKRDSSLACHHIPLNSAGETLAHLYRSGTQLELDRLFHAWLGATIRRLELEMMENVKQSSQQDHHAPPGAPKAIRQASVGFSPAMQIAAGAVICLIVAVIALSYLVWQKNDNQVRRSAASTSTWDRSLPTTSPLTGHVEIPVQKALSSTTVSRFPDGGIRWYLSAIGADKVKLGDLGFAQIPGVAVVGVVNSGVDANHPLLKPVLWRLPEELETPYWPTGSVGYDFHINKADPRDETENSHGTHVIGLVTGRQIALWNPVFDEAGLADNVKAFVLKITAPDGSFDFTAAQNAIEAGITNHISIFNVSLFGPYSQMLQQDLARAERRNSILFVAAAGNDITDLDATPDYHRTFRNDDGSGLANVIFVAALSDEGGLAPFSNYGKSLVQIAAPGTGISSTVTNGKMGLMSGSSEAAPIVTLVAAILKAEKPDILPLAIKNRILNTCDWDESLTDKVANGCKLNLLKAVICHADLVELRNGDLLRGDLDPAEFSSQLPGDSSLVRIHMTSPKSTVFVYASGRREANSFLRSSLALKVHFGEVCPHPLNQGICRLSPAEIKEIIFRFK